MIWNVIYFLMRNVQSVPCTRNMYEDYLTEYNKYYNLKEVEYRFPIFCENLKTIEKHNAMDLSWKMGINQFTDTTFDEFKNTMKHTLPQKNHISHKMDISTLPDYVDWRTDGYVTPVKNQEQCGSCWAFSAVATLEGQHKKNTGKLLSLSEQNLVDCSQNFGNNGCEGGWPTSGLEYIIYNQGVDTEQSYPYKGTDDKCAFNKTNIGGNLTQVVNITKGNVSELNHAIATVGPISVAIVATPQFQMYQSGIFELNNCGIEPLNHAVTAVGYGFSGNKTFYIIKNSWGPDWGMDGYIYFSKDIPNMCGIAEVACYPQ